MSDIIDLSERRHRQQIVSDGDTPEAIGFVRRHIEAGAKGVFVVAFYDDSYSWARCGVTLKADMAYCAMKLAQVAVDDEP